MLYGIGRVRGPAVAFNQSNTGYRQRATRAPSCNAQEKWTGRPKTALRNAAPGWLEAETIRIITKVSLTRGADLNVIRIVYVIDL